MIPFPATYAWLAGGVLLVAAEMLFKKVQAHRQAHKGIVGETAYVGSQGLTQKKGEVTCSGVIRKARLSESTTEEALEAGASVVITGVRGGTLLVKPKE